MTVSGIATEIYTNLGSPSDTTEASVQYWLRTSVGELNSRIFTNYLLVGGTTTGEVLDSSNNQISGDAVSIYKKMYEVYRWNAVIRNKMAALDSDSLLEVTDNGSAVRYVNKNEVIKSLKDLKSQDTLDLEKLIQGYNSHLSPPTAIHGDDDQTVLSVEA